MWRSSNTVSKTLVAHHFEWNRQLLYYDLMLFKIKQCCLMGNLTPFFGAVLYSAAPRVSPEAKVGPAETAGFAARHTADTLCCQQGCFSVRHLCSFLSSEVRLPDTKESRASEWLIPRQSRQHAGLQHRSALINSNNHGSMYGGGTEGSRKRKIKYNLMQI